MISLALTKWTVHCEEPPMPCPEPSQLDALTRDELAESARREIEQHLDECEDCRRGVAVLMRAARSPENAGDVGLANTLASAPVAAATTLAPGTRVGRYGIREVIGSGGMGVVYRADDPELGRDVALKLLRESLVHHTLARSQIIREAQAMARLTHPNVATVFDVGMHDEQLFVAMERVRGKSLRMWLRERRSVREIVNVFVEAGRGLAAAHDAGLVHRDFKPDNVLVGDDGRIRVVDFGLVHDVTSGTSDDEVVGTPAYMSPEQHAGAVIDARTDQFAFCVSLHESLFGVRPFKGGSRAQLAAAVLANERNPIPAAHRVPSSLRKLVERGLAIRPGERFATMNALLAALAKDRARVPRRVAAIACAVLGIVGIAFAADAVVRDRERAVTRSSFESGGVQLAHQLEARTETFSALSDLSYVLPIMAEAAGHDQSDFGLDSATADRERLANIHANLISADWGTFARANRKGDFAIADGKGRLLYASAAPERWGTDVRAVPALARAYREVRETTAAVVRGDDPGVVASGLLGGAPRLGLYVALARTKLVGEQPRALFVQLVAGARLLGDLAVGAGTQLALIAPDGSREGALPDGIAVTHKPGIREIDLDGTTWLVEEHPLSLGGEPGDEHRGETLATIVLARPFDVGLAGLFPHARQVLGVAAVLALVLGLGGIVVARRRDSASPARR
jgi:hypothetical protein